MCTNESFFIFFCPHSQRLKNGALGMKMLLQVSRLKVAMEMFLLHPMTLTKSLTTSKTWLPPSGKHRRYVHTRRRSRVSSDVNFIPTHSTQTLVLDVLALIYHKMRKVGV